MSEPLVVTIPHRLGKAEALRRIKDGLAQTRTSLGGKLLTIDEQWSGDNADHLDFKGGIMGQSTSGAIDVFDEHVRLEIQLPWMLAKLANTAKAMLQKQTTLMLEKK